MPEKVNHSERLEETASNRGRRRPNLMALIATPIIAAVALSACSTNPGEGTSGVDAEISAPTTEVSPEVRELMTGSPWESGQWGVLVADEKTGEVVQSLNADSQFVTGSTAKTFAVGAALDVLGSDHRFRTPIVRTGDVAEDGRLDGDLIMVGSGDLALGGRSSTPDTLEVPDFDHFDANAVPGMATLTPQDPLSGLDELASQIADEGIRQINGDIIVDNRLWEPISIGGVPITPTMVNDNLVDLLITPHGPGEPATVDWRPKTAAFTVEADVLTTPTGTKPAVTVDANDPGHIRVHGTVPADAKAPFVATYQVPDPPAFARTLLIEALARHGVTTSAPTVGANPSDALPPKDRVAALPVSATYTSPPFSEYAKLINKVSHNLGANLLPPLMAAQHGLHTYEDGMQIERDFLTRNGIDPESFSLVDAQGLPGDKATPLAQTELLRVLSRRDDFGMFYDSMPSLGVDGSLADVIDRTDPAAGQIRAKTGTLVDAPNGKLELTTKALAGYMNAQSGRRLVFAIYVNNIPVSGDSVSDAIDLALDANKQLGAIAAAIYRSE